MKFDIVALGELLIDFTPKTVPGEDETYFQKNAGGAPANVLAALARQGKRTAFIGKVGADSFGSFLASVLEDSGVSTSGLVYSDTASTTLAFVELNSDGDRSFTFYRKPGADMMLEQSEVNLDIIANAAIFHFGSLSMTHEPARSATFAALAHAKEQGKLISYDPNLRLPLWPDEATACTQILAAMPYADVVKVSEEELLFLTGSQDLATGAKQLKERFGLSLLCVTLGEKGCYYQAGAYTGHVPAFSVQAIDTTGAGDAFMGGLLSRLLDYGARPSGLSDQELQDIIRHGTASGSLATTKRGGIPAMPSKAEVAALLVNSGQSDGST
ncbi:carbohydrate kinase [Paenibacillus oenotherae]|uniref:Carbohydrate kinase n=1 Tax=Paenibacillus oenotherae TaxID=1435645 RepID=A0ABS7D8Z2_9BACL|nr:PfkB family carbohydrate kinase [Paenibacillus oenotherae]MBW7476341.1 carbohydrate kinase [Paenibacillus oenotherae]